MAVKWSRKDEQFARETLAPGWEGSNGGFRCPRCRHRGCTDDPGACGTCGKGASSGMFKLCPPCATAAGRCMMCPRRVGPVTPGVTPWIGSGPPQLGERETFRVNVQAGKDVTLWLNVRGKAAAPEIPCPGGKDLARCPELFFLVQPHGADAKVRAVACAPADRPAQAAGGRKPPVLKPLTGPASVKVKLDEKDFAGRAVFDKPGAYIVRAVVGRHVSNAVTVIVAGDGPIPPALAGCVPIFTPGQNTVAAQRDGKLVWKMKLNFPVASVEIRGGEWVIQSGDGSGSATVDAATGRVLRRDRQPR